MIRLVAVLALSALVFPAFVASAAEFSGYVKPTALNVREDAGAKSAIAGILLKYDPVTVPGEVKIGRTRWYSIKASGGYVTGWVAARFIARGEAPAGMQEAEIDYGAQETPTLLRGDFKYVGVRICADCHTESTGSFDKGAVPVWENHFHSQAHKTLQRDYTKQIASRTRGVEDPEYDWRCLKCHQAAFGAGPEQTASTYRAEEGVGCEVCHGPGSMYADEDHGPDVANREAMGFRVLRNLSDRRAVCTSCHNKASPTYIGFDLREFSRKIAHWVDRPDADYYAEYGQEAKRRVERATMTPAPDSGAAEARAAAAANQAAAEAARADAAAAEAATKAAAEAAAKKADADARASANAAEAAEAAEAAAAAKAEAAAEAAEAKAAQAKADAAAARAAKAEEARASADAAKAAQAAAAEAAQARADAAEAEAAQMAEAAKARAQESARMAAEAEKAQKYFSD